jgi:hypothetical protein
MEQFARRSVKNFVCATATIIQNHLIRVCEFASLRLIKNFYFAKKFYGSAVVKLCW